MSHEHHSNEPEQSLDELWALTTEGNDDATRGLALIKIATRLRSEGDTWGAVAAAQAVVDHFTKAMDFKEVANASLFLGEALLELDNISEAAEAFRESAKHYQEVVYDSGRGQALRQLGNCYIKLNEPDTAVATWRSAAALLEADGEPAWAGVVSLDIGDQLGSENRQSEALEAFKEAQRLFRIVGDLIGAARAHDRTAAALIDLNRITEAIGHLREALWILEYLPEGIRTTYARYRLGWTLVTNGEYDEALPLLDRAIGEYKAMGNYVDAANCDRQRAHAFNAMGDTQTAQRLYRQVKSIYEGAGENQDVLITQVNLAECLVTQGDLLNAEIALAEAVDKAQAMGDKWLENSCRVRLAEVYLEREQATSALEVIAPIDAQDWGDNAQNRVRHLNAQAAAKIETGYLQEAHPMLEQVLSLADSAELGFEKARAYELLARVLRSEEQPEAFQVQAQAIALYLACGHNSKALELSSALKPNDTSMAQRLLRTQDGQMEFTENTEKPETDLSGS